MTKKETSQKKMIQKRTAKTSKKAESLDLKLESLIKKYLKETKGINVTGALYVSSIEDCYSVYWKNLEGDEGSILIDIAPLFRYFLYELNDLLNL